jgi:hypothetical protein
VDEDAKGPLHFCIYMYVYVRYDEIKIIRYVKINTSTEQVCAAVMLYTSSGQALDFNLGRD